MSIPVLIFENKRANMDDVHIDRGSICACRPVSYDNRLHALLSSQERTSFGRFNHINSAPMMIPRRMDSNNYILPDVDQKQSNTLQSVLMGDIPPAYSHLTSNRLSPYSTSPVQRHSPKLKVPSHFNNYSIHRTSPVSPHDHSRGVSPCRSPYSSSPRLTSSSPRMTSPLQAMSPPHSLSSPNIPSSSPQLLSSSLELPRYSGFSVSPMPPSPFSDSSFQDEPMDLSRRTKSKDSDLNIDDSSKIKNGDVSMLRKLLCVGKSLGGVGTFHDSDTDESDSDSRHAIHVTGNTRVTLAKKNLLPVGSRVSDWLVKIVQFVKSVPEFHSVSHNDKITLILNSWTKIMLLYMAEDNFEFVVTPTHHSKQDLEESQATPSPEEPTMKSSETIQTFIRKFQAMNLDQKEYAFLRMAVLFNSGYAGIERPSDVEQINSLIQRLLQEHVRVSRPNDLMHYSKLLLCLPSLYGINSKMIENLFCKHINGNMDIDVLLKEMLQNL
ncbi:protein dissatisfaction-like isoform X1 [Mytilus californianus]|uniref:protein dissatisfaction-like isoform X1 n=1 Tax=Mytilus californianus TaxID=6549 RepID=UPI002247ACC7|nr:protein dissatisfaction-like isoform X1 [Mytilus californianus]